MIVRQNDCGRSFPRLYAAASLKPTAPPVGRGAITGFPRLYAAASLKLAIQIGEIQIHPVVFRGFMPRPH